MTLNQPLTDLVFKKGEFWTLKPLSWILTMRDEIFHVIVFILQGCRLSWWWTRPCPDCPCWRTSGDLASAPGTALDVVGVRVPKVLSVVGAEQGFDLQQVSLLVLGELGEGGGVTIAGLTDLVLEHRVIRGYGHRGHGPAVLHLVPKITEESVPQSCKDSQGHL